MGVNGVGEIFVYFANSDDATKAKNLLASRTYNSNPIKIVFYPENLFKMQRYALNWVEPDDSNIDSNSSTNEESASGNNGSVGEASMSTTNNSNDKDNNDNNNNNNATHTTNTITAAITATSMEELD